MKHGSISTLLAAGAIALAGVYASCNKTAPEPAPSSNTDTKPADSAAKTDPKATAGGASAPSPHTSGGPSTGGPSIAAAAGPGDVAYDAPAAWTSVPNSNSMRKATYKIPKAGDAEDAELTFSSVGGGLEQNIKRWAGQFGGAEPKTEKRKVNGLDVTIVEMKGAYSGGMPAMGGGGPAKKDQMLLGAVVDGGEMQHFFKMVGPEKTVLAARKDFDKLVSSLRAK